MEWSKLKNIIIIILLLLNGFLLLLVWGWDAQDARSREAARLEAIAFVQSEGVELSESAVPRAMDLLPMEVSRDLEAEEGLAGRLLGEVTAEARGGQVYRYFNQSGSVQFHSGGEFSARFAPGAFPVGELDAAEYAASVLAQLNIRGRAVESTFSGGEGSITFLQELDGVPLLDCRIVLRFENGCLTAIAEGKRLPGTPCADGRSAVAVSTALMRLYNGLRELGDVYSRIDGITQAYTLSVSLSGPARLTPVWYVRTDTGAYQLDVVTGALTRASGRV